MRLAHIDVDVLCVFPSGQSAKYAINRYVSVCLCVAMEKYVESIKYCAALENVLKVSNIEFPDPSGESGQNGMNEPNNAMICCSLCFMGYTNTEEEESVQ